jgi:hypothetical protein
MVKMVAPKYANLGMELIVSYIPPDEKVSSWHTVSSRKESLLAIAKQYTVPVERLIEFNFPGSVPNGRINPDIVNWYLYNHKAFNCRQATPDGFNYMFKGGEQIAIPYLGQVEIGEPDIIKSRNTKFKIKMHANLNATLVIGGDFSIFQIWDEKAGRCSFYTYWADAVGGSLIPGAWLSATLAGPWNDFTVTKEMGAHQFDGPARFSTGGGGNWTWNYINFMALPVGTKTIPNPLRIDTGFTIGIGAGTSAGLMRLEMLGTTDGLLPFKGP